MVDMVVFHSACSCDAECGKQSSSPQVGKQAQRKGSCSATSCCARQRGCEPVRGLQPYRCRPEGVCVDGTDQPCSPDRSSKGVTATTQPFG